MHLAIAGLGQGVPVMALTYQDKFEGLFRHFDQPERTLLDAEAILEPQRLAAAMDGFVEERDALKARVVERWPRVHALARATFGTLRA